MCGPDWTVRPHRYTPTLPGVRGMKSRTKRVAVSYRRSVTLQGYPAGIAHNERVAGETAQTLDRGLRLLHLVADAPGGLTMTEAAARLGVGRAVVYRLVSTLAEHGMVRRDGGGRLRLGAGVLHLARRVGATAHLTVADAGEAVALAVVEPTWTQFHVAYRTGSRHPLDRGAAGRAILAGRRGATGYVTTDGELQPGAHGVAAPIAGVEGLEASVGVVALAALEVDTVGPAVVATAGEIAKALS